MIAYETSVGTNGYQNLLFPLAYLRVTQGENGSYSHQGTLSIDFSGWGPNGKVYLCPYYAPCDLRCTTITSYGIIWTSINPVNFVDGTLDYITLALAHDNDVHSHTIGEIILQGNLLGHTGTNGGVADHVHMNVAKGQNKNLYLNPYGHYMLQDSYHIYDAMGVNDTVISYGYGYNWKSFTPGPTPPGPTPPVPPINFTRKSHFKFYLYNRKRNI